jgi:hypothetical protein
LVERTLQVEANCLDPADLAHFYWEPIENSLYQLFVVRVASTMVRDADQMSSNWHLGLMVDQYTSSPDIEREAPRAMVVSPATL